MLKLSDMQTLGRDLMKPKASFDLGTATFLIVAAAAAAILGPIVRDARQWLKGKTEDDEPDGPDHSP